MTIEELGRAIVKETDPERKREMLAQYRAMSAMPLQPQVCQNDRSSHTGI